MRHRLRTLAWIAVTIATFVGGGAPAHAANGDGPGGTTPTTAIEASSKQVCDLAGGPFPDQDVWAFVTSTGVPLHNLTALFTDAAGAGHTAWLRPDDQAVEPDGRSVAFVRTPGGWTLTAASADLIDVRPPQSGDTAPSGSPTPTGTDARKQGPTALAQNIDHVGLEQSLGSNESDVLLLVGTCVAAAPGLALVPDRAGQPATTRPAGTAPAEPVTPSPIDGVAAPAEAVELAATGQDIGSMFIVGSALVITGVLLLIVRRRRRVPRRAPAGDDSGLVWINPPQ
jgi:LPXTG-motif cell wall-anchored protein